MHREFIEIIVKTCTVPCVHYRLGAIELSADIAHSNPRKQQALAGKALEKKSYITVDFGF